MKDIYSNFVRLVARLLVFIITGCGFTTMISVLFVHSENYCRDCNTGLGLVTIGFGISLFATPILLWLPLDIYNHHRFSGKQKRKRKRKDDELEDNFSP